MPLKEKIRNYSQSSTFVNIFSITLKFVRDIFQPVAKQETAEEYGMNINVKKPAKVHDKNK